MKKILVLLILLIGYPAWATDYTVKTSGGDYSNIITCMNAISAGDRCVVYAGTYSGGNITTSGSSNTVRKTLIADTVGAQPVVSSAINCTDEQYITISGFEFSGMGSGSALTCSGCSFITFHNNDVDNTDIGIGSSGENLAGNDILIDGNRFINDRGDDVVKGYGDRWVIRNNASGNIVDSLNEHIDFFQSSCAFDDPSDFTLIENNYHYNITGGNCQFFLINCSAGSRYNFILRYNKVKTLGSGYTVFDDVAGGNGFTGVSIYNNVFSDGSSARNVGHIDLETSGTGIFYNNILYDAMSQTEAQGFSTTSNIPVNGTLAYDPDGTINFWDPLSSCSDCVKNDNPDFVDYGAAYASVDFSLQEGSPAIDAGHELTNTDGSGNSATSLTVDNAYPFQDGWAGVDPDCIAIGSASNTACIVSGSINYSAGTMTLDTALTWLNGDEVWLYKKSDGDIVLAGDAPDIGAVEYGVTEEPTSTPATIQRATIQRGIFVGGD